MNFGRILAAIGLLLGLHQSTSVTKSTLQAIPSYYNDTLVMTQAAPVPIPELSFLFETLKIAEAHGWHGMMSGPLPISLNNYNQKLLTRLVTDETIHEEGMTIPDNLIDIYTTPAAQAEMMTLLYQVRREYLDYAVQKGINQIYIDEINRHTLPNDQSRMNYYPDRHYPGAEGTNTHLYEQSPQNDNSQLQIDVYASSIYRYALEFQQSGVLGPTATGIDYRNMALRYALYHEMTHALQHAFDVVNAPEQDKLSLMPWIYTQRSVLKIDSTHYQTWGNQTDPLVRDINNLTVAKESQAEGISIQMIGDVYHLSPVQNQLVWEYHFGVLSQGTKNVDQTFQLLQKIAPDDNLEAVVHQIQTDLIDKLPNQASALTVAFSHMEDRLDGLMATHVGYLNPMLPQETQRFWDYLKK